MGGGGGAFRSIGRRIFRGLGLFLGRLWVGIEVWRFGRRTPKP